MPGPSRAGLATVLASLIPLVSQASAQPATLEARVVWVRGDQVYLASPDSLAVEPGARLTFVSRGKVVAAGEVSAVYDRALAVARLRSGSLARVKRPDKLAILVEHPGPPAIPMLRVGYPSRARATPFFACEMVSLGRPPRSATYRAESQTARSYRLVREADVAGRASWPETLLVRLFDESADEEIALERGELDVAVLWPGELSPQARARASPEGPLSGARARGVVAAVGLAPDPSVDSTALTLSDSLAFASLNQELFRGELAPFRGDWGVGAGTAGGRSRFQVDPAFPGRAVLERFLNGTRPAAGGPVSARVVRLFHIDAPWSEPDSLALAVASYVRAGAFAPAVRARADSLEAEVRRVVASGGSVGFPRLRQHLRDRLRVTLLFVIECPVLTGPGLRAYVSALGTDAFVNLLDCALPGRTP